MYFSISKSQIGIAESIWINRIRMLETIPPIKRKKTVTHEGNCKWKIGVMTSLFSSILTHPLRCHLVNWGCVGCQRKITQWPCSPEQWDFFWEAKKFNLAKPHWLWNKNSYKYLRDHMDPYGWSFLVPNHPFFWRHEGQQVWDIPRFLQHLVSTPSSEKHEKWMARWYFKYLKYVYIYIYIFAAPCLGNLGIPWYHFY